MANGRQPTAPRLAAPPALAYVLIVSANVECPRWECFSTTTGGYDGASRWYPQVPQRFFRGRLSAASEHWQSLVAQQAPGHGYSGENRKDMLAQSRAY